MEINHPLISSSALRAFHLLHPTGKATHFRTIQASWKFANESFTLNCFSFKRWLSLTRRPRHEILTLKKNDKLAAMTSSHGLSVPTLDTSVSASPTISTTQSLETAGVKRKRISDSKLYCVRSGHQPGIYHSWPECFAQVKGFKGAICRLLNADCRAATYRCLQSSHSPL